MIGEKLIPASYRGLSILVPDTNLTDGRKTVTHEFINSSVRFVEDLGKFPAKFQMPLIVSGNDAIQKRDNLRQLLNKPGPGILVIPSYGRQEVVVEGQYTVKETDTSLGEFRFDVTFAISSTAVFPSVGAASTSTVASAEQTARASFLGRLSDLWTPPKTAFSINDAATKLQDYASGILSEYGPVIDDASAIKRQVEDTVDGAIQIVRQGQDVAQSISNILDAVDNIDIEDLGTLKAIKSLLNFGTGDTSIVNKNGLSIDQANRLLNRGLLNSAVRATSLVKAYTVSTQVDFQVVERLTANRQELSSATGVIRDNIQNVAVEFNAASAAGVKTNPSIDRESLNNLYRTRTQAEKVFDTLIENLFRQVTTKQHLTSASLLSYQLFENNEQTEILANLNKRQRPSTLSGTLTALNK